MEAQTNLGDAYFDTRARLSSAIYGLSKLVEEIDLDASRTQILSNLLTTLKEPFLFVVVGEVNAGKSTLLNALFGEEFCESAAVPMTSEICLFKYGTYEKDVCVTDTYTELYRPNEFLQDFNIVDTPGTNSIVENHQEITERFIPMADLVVFTFSVTNPWGGTAWVLLDQIHKRWFKNVVFALQQCDLREDEEIEAIVEHMKVTAMQRLGSHFPIFPISGKKALLGKTTAVDKKRLLKESNFQAFEDHISSVVNSPQVRERKLGNASRSARVILNEARDKLDSGARILQADEELVESLGTEVSAQHKRTMDKFGAFYRGLDTEFMELSIEGTRRFQESMNMGLGMRQVSELPQLIEDRILQGMLNASSLEVDAASRIIEEDLQDLWRRLADNMQEHFNFRLRVGSETGEPEWTQQREHMSQRLMAVLERNVPRMQLGTLLNHRMRKRSAGQIGFTLVGTLAVVVGALLHFLGLIPDHAILPAVLGVVALVFCAVVFGGMYSQRTARRLIYDLGDHFQAFRGQLGEAIRTEIGEEVNGFFDDFLQLFEPLHQLCNEHRLRYQPQITELRRLEDSFNDVDLLIGLEPDEKTGKH